MLAIYVQLVTTRPSKTQYINFRDEKGDELPLSTLRIKVQKFVKFRDHFLRVYYEDTAYVSAWYVLANEIWDERW